MKKKIFYLTYLLGVWRSEDNSEELILFYCVFLGSDAGSGLQRMHFNRLSHLLGPVCILLFLL